MGLGALGRLGFSDLGADELLGERLARARVGRPVHPVRPRHRGPAEVTGDRELYDEGVRRRVREVVAAV